MDRMLVFIIGILTLIWVPALLPASVWISLFVFVLLTASVTHLFYKKAQHIILLILCAVSGAGYGQWHAEQHRLNKLTPEFDNTEFIVEGVVSRVVSQVVRHDVIHAKEKKNITVDAKNTYWRNNNKQKIALTFNVIHIQQHEKNTEHLFSNNYPKRLRLTYFGEKTLTSGQHLRMKVKLRSPRHFANPGGFDHIRMMYSQHIDAYGYIKHKYPIVTLGQKKLSIFNRIRLDRLSTLSPIIEKLEQGPYLLALLLGDKSSMTEEQKTLLRETGTSHLMAISGLHIAIAGGLGVALSHLIINLFPKALLYLPRIYYLAIASLPIAMFYAVLAGLSIPTQRALIMITSVVLAQCFQRYIHRWNYLLIALTVILLWDPLSSLDAGFWFSFVAVALLLYGFSQPNNTFHTNAQKPSEDNINYAILLYDKTYQFFFGALKTQWILFIGMPVMLLLFNNSQPLIAPLANVLVVPIVGFFVVPMGILSVALSYIHHYPATLLLTCANAILDMAIGILEWLAHFNIPALTGAVPDWSYYQLIAVLIAVIVLLSRIYMPGYGLAFLCWLIMLLPLNLQTENTFSHLQQGEFILTQLDVGQGSAILISTRDQHWLYDTGGKFSSKFDAGRGIIAPYLKHLGVYRLNGVFISHGDQDHAGGAMSLAKMVDVDQWVLGGNANQLHLANTQLQCENTMSWEMNGIKLRVLYPLQTSSGNNVDSHLKPKKIIKKENDQSCVLQIIAESNRSLVLMTGDISRKSERILMTQYGAELQTETLIVPHHGSRTSSSKPFLEAVAPDRALVSAGFNNRYRHPHPTIIRRYAQQGIALLRSDELGAIQYRFVGGEWFGPYCHRFSPKHFWQRWNNEDKCVAALSSQALVKS